MTAPRAWVHTSYAQRIHFGAGAAAELPDVVKEAGGRRVALVTSATRGSSDEGQRLARALGRALVATFDGARPHVPASAVREAVRLARAEDLDGVVSFGGGSAVDLAKAICFFGEQERGMPGSSYVDRPAVAHVAVPTTYSGAEATAVFGMTDDTTRVKQGAGSPTLAPLAVVYDPDLTAGLPAQVRAGSGMAAVAHGVEVAYSPSRTPEAELVALGAVRALAEALPAAVDRDDPDSRAAALAGAALAGRCLQNGTVGLHHGLAELLGGRTGLPHGVAGAVLLAPVMRFNLEAAGEAAGRIGEALGDQADPAGAADRLRRRLGLPGGLEQLGVADEDLQAVARAARSHPAVRANVRPVGEGDIRHILEAAWVAPEG